MIRFYISILESLVYWRGWWAAPRQAVKWAYSPEQGEIDWLFYRWALVAMCVEGLLALQIIDFLTTHGQL